jgi:hypothetical protein
MGTAYKQLRRKEDRDRAVPASMDQYFLWLQTRMKGLSLVDKNCEGSTLGASLVCLLDSSGMEEESIPRQLHSSVSGYLGVTEHNLRLREGCWLQ